MFIEHSSCSRYYPRPRRWGGHRPGNWVGSFVVPGGGEPVYTGGRQEWKRSEITSQPCGWGERQPRRASGRRWNLWWPEPWVVRSTWSRHQGVSKEGFTGLHPAGRRKALSELAVRFGRSQKPWELGNAVKSSSGDRGKSLEGAVGQWGVCSCRPWGAFCDSGRGKLTRSELYFGKTDLVSVWEGTGQPDTSGLEMRVKVWDTCRWLRSATKAT